MVQPSKSEGNHALLQVFSRDTDFFMWDSYAATDGPPQAACCRSYQLSSPPSRGNDISRTDSVGLSATGRYASVTFSRRSCIRSA